MGHRLSKIYTRTGDLGETGLGDGARVAKNALRVEAFGTVDELNSCIGVILAHDNLPKAVFDVLTPIQHTLFDLGSELCLPEYIAMTEAHTTSLEDHLDSFNQDLPMLKEFILPGGGKMCADCHMARTICRRAERHVVALHHETPINPAALKYLNRLSDLLFVIARVLVRAEGGQEVLWEHEKVKPKKA